jgi:hypothetical protein
MHRIILAAALAVPIAAYAEVRDIPWYMAHPTILYRTIEVCHESAAYEDTVDCRNAEAAVDGLWAREEGQRSGLAATLNDPAYWARNPIARRGMLVECSRREPGDAAALPFCPAVAKSFSIPGTH